MTIIIILTMHLFYLLLPIIIVTTLLFLLLLVARMNNYNRSNYNKISLLHPRHRHHRINQCRKLNYVLQMRNLCFTMLIWKHLVNNKYMHRNNNKASIKATKQQRRIHYTKTIEKGNIYIYMYAGGFLFSHSFFFTLWSLGDKVVLWVNTHNQPTNQHYL